MSDQMRKALELISEYGCDRFTDESGETCRTEKGLTKDARYDADRWCNACIAAWGLGQ